jgi:hypothetical protein
MATVAAALPVQTPLLHRKHHPRSPLPLHLLLLALLHDLLSQQSMVLHRGLVAWEYLLLRDRQATPITCLPSHLTSIRRRWLLLLHFCSVEVLSHPLCKARMALSIQLPS